MIKIDFSFAIALYLGIVFFAIIFLWIMMERKKNSLNSYDYKKEFIWHCEICGYTYVNSKDLSLSKCPRCESYNEHKKLK